MIGRIIEFSVRQKAFVVFLMAIIGIIGWFSFKALPIDAVPDITNVQVQVNAAVEGYVPEEIERYITQPIEIAMGGIPNILQVRSTSRPGLSQVTIVFEEGTDIYRSRQLVAERLQQLGESIPNEIHPKLAPISTGLGEIFHYSVTAKQEKIGEERARQLMELRAIQEWIVKPRLLMVKGVAEVNTIGGYEKQYHLHPNISKMARYGIHFDDLIETIERTNRNIGGGNIQQSADQFLVQGVGLFRSIDDIRRVPVKALETFKTVTVGDVADVTLGTQLRTGASLVDGKEQVLGTVLMLMGENSRAVATRVSEKIEEIKAALPDGVRLEPLYTRSELVDSTLKTVEHNLLLGALLVVLILLLLVGNVRAAVITAITIPLTLLITFIVMRCFGMSVNLMSLGALDFGIIVDGVVIVMDNCVRLIQDRAKRSKLRLTQSEVQGAVYDGAREVLKAAGFGVLTIVVIFLPILFLGGIEGKMFRPMAATFAIAMLAALVLSFTVAPALATLLLKGNVVEKEPWLMRKIRDFYVGILDVTLRCKEWVIAVGVVAVVLGGVLFTRLGGEFIPQLDEGALLYQFVRPTNIGIDQSVELEKYSEAIIKEFSEVQHVFSRIGISEIATDPMGVNMADAYVTLKPKKEWPRREGGRRLSKQELGEAILKKLEAEVPGQRVLVSQPIQLRFNELMEGIRADVSLKVFGNDMQKISETATRVAEVIRKVKGAGDVELETQGTSPILRIDPKKQALLALGMSEKEIMDSVAIGLGGREVGRIYDGLMQFPIFVRLDEKDRSDLAALHELPIGIGLNSVVPLKELADVSFVEGFGSVSREEFRRRAAIMVNPRGRDTQSFVADAQQMVAKEVKLGDSMFIEWGGNFKNLQEATRTLGLLTPIAIALVMLMIYAAFRSVSQTLMVFSCAPLAVVGGVLALLIRGMPFSISAGIGFIALVGIAVLNGVVLMNYFNDLRGKGLHGDDLLREGTSIRLRPVLMTALVDIMGFLPMMLSTGVGAEVQRPLATVVTGGVISSTALTLLVLPSLYGIVERFEKRKVHLAIVPACIETYEQAEPKTAGLSSACCNRAYEEGQNHPEQPGHFV